MAYPPEHHGSCSNGGALRVVLLVVAMLSVGYMLGPHLSLKKSSKNFQASCPPCDCDCFEDFAVPSEFCVTKALSFSQKKQKFSISWLLFVSGKLFNFQSPTIPYSRTFIFHLTMSIYCSADFNGSLSAADCGKKDPYMKEEMEKNMLALMSEEINLQRRVANETLERSLALATESRIASWHYQKEAEKCIAQTEACEEARQRAEAELIEERRLSALWENRARELGFNDARRQI